MAGVLKEPVPGMAVHTQTEGFPRVFVRFLMAPAAVGALVVTATALLRRYTRKPAVQRMSEDWLRSHDVGRRRISPW
jgi:hypothetical protein